MVGGTLLLRRPAVFQLMHRMGRLNAGGAGYQHTTDADRSIAGTLNALGGSGRAAEVLVFSGTLRPLAAG